jgi:hypothetical protein
MAFSGLIISEKEIANATGLLGDIKLNEEACEIKPRPRLSKIKSEKKAADEALLSPAEKSKAAKYGEWQADVSATECTKCQAEFGIFLFKHHCRACGSLVCDPCSQVA